AVTYIQMDSAALLGFVVEHGLEAAWGGHSVEGDGLFSTSFRQFDPINQQTYYIELCNRGGGILDYSIEAKDDWIILSKDEGNIRFDEKVYVSINWDKAPKGKITGEIEIKGSGLVYTVQVPLNNAVPEASGFVANNGVVSFEAANFSRKVDSKKIHWTI